MGALMTLGAIAKGIKQGAQQYGENMRAIDNDERLKRAEERQKVSDERDAKRFEMEQARMDREKKALEANDEYMKISEQIDNDAANGIGEFQKAGFIGQPQQAIQNPDGTSTPAPQNPFMVPVDGRYKNQRLADEIRMGMKASALEKLYRARGEPEKAEMVRTQLAEVLDKDIDRKLKAALAGFAMGAPGSIERVASVYGYFSDGKAIDPTSGAFDPKTKTWTGIRILDEKTGKVVGTRDFTQEDILGLAKRDAVAMIAFNIERADKKIEQEFEGRKVSAIEQQAKAADKKADADMIDAVARKDRYSAISGMEVGQTKAANISARGKAFDDAFPMAGKTIKPGEVMNAEKEALQVQIAADTRMRDRAVALSGLNPRVDPYVLAYVAKQAEMNGGKLQGVQMDKNGIPFVTVNGVKVVLK